MAAYANNSVDAVVRLLLLTLYADRVKKPEESEEVFRRLPDLAVFADGVAFGSVPDFETLIAKHDTEVQQALDDSDLLAFTERAISAIDDPLLVPSVLDAMRSIAYADEEYHHTEEHLIEQAERQWGLHTA